MRPRSRTASPATDDDRAEITRLALAAGAGDQAALEAFVTLTMDEVWRYSASVLGPARADDAAQEVFARVVKALPAFRGDSSARSWLLSITRYVLIDDMRARKRQRSLFDRAAAQPLDTESVDDHLPVELTEALSRLAPDQRDAFALTQIMGLPYQDAADLTGCPIGTIRSRVARARANLLELLEDQSHQEDGLSV